MADSTLTKVCISCEVDRATTDFAADRQCPDGLQSRCRACKAAAAKRYRSTKRAERAEYQRKWRAENPSRNQELMRRHARTAYDKDSSKAVERANRRRALILERKVGPVDLQGLWDAQGDACPLCETPIDRTLKWPDAMCASLDHIVPLALGGTHEQSNLQWTHLVCNIRKGAKAS